MNLVITGSEGNIGRALRKVFPDAIGIDRRQCAHIICDLHDANLFSGPVGDALASADAVIHLATSPDPHSSPKDHFASLTATTRLVEACACLRVPRLILPSSGWAYPTVGWPRRMTAYGWSKRAIEALAEMYRAAGLHCVALRYGWVAERVEDLPQDAPPALLASWWSYDRLEHEVRAALAGGGE